MSTPKRPMGLGAARLAKRQKTADEKEPEERHIASTGSALEDLMELLRSALTTGDVAFFRAVINEADRLIRLSQSAEASDEEEELPKSPEQLARVRVAFGRALLGLGWILTQAGSDARRPEEPESIEDWLSAAQEQLESARAHLPEKNAELLWLEGLVNLHQAALGDHDRLKDSLRAFAKVSEDDRPVDGVETAALLAGVAAEIESENALKALEWAQDTLREGGEDSAAALAAALLAIAAIVWAGEEATADTQDDWTLPQTEQMEDAREAAAEAAGIFERLLAETPDDAALKGQLGEALILQANLTREEDEQEELYRRAEEEAGVSLDDGAEE